MDNTWIENRLVDFRDKFAFEDGSRGYLRKVVGRQDVIGIENYIRDMFSKLRKLILEADLNKGKNSFTGEFDDVRIPGGTFHSLLGHRNI